GLHKFLIKCVEGCIPTPNRVGKCTFLYVKGLCEACGNEKMMAKYIDRFPLTADLERMKSEAGDTPIAALITQSISGLARAERRRPALILSSSGVHIEISLFSDFDHFNDYEE
ncbi:hypothetical protein PFISCL1PPCAC_20130, partial [Pristionchus fissidentatus]